MLINFYDFHPLCSRENDYSHRDQMLLLLNILANENGAEKNEIFEQ
jgi:hypothetical protein